MAHKDYIKRASPKPKKASPRNKKTVEVKKRPPIVAISLLTVILFGFAYALWFINGTASNTSAPLGAATSSPESKKAISTNVAAGKNSKAQPDIPPPPENEKWQYIEELKNKTVDVEVTEVENKGPYLMQCATFKESRRAEIFKAQLALLGFESRIKVTESPQGPRHRVQLGPYETNRDAQRARHQLSKHNINGCKIWLWS